MMRFLLWPHLLLWRLLTRCSIACVACRGTRIVSVATGAAHSAALASDGSVYTWGDGSRGQLGHQQLQAIAVPCIQNTILLLLPQKIACLNPSLLSPENRCVRHWV